MRNKTILYTDDAEIALPTRWHICDSCEGHGTSSRCVERDGGGFTASEWAEEDEDFREDYMAGRYDRTCDECGGSGKVQIVDVDEDALDAEALKAWQAQCEDDWDERMCESERRIGA